MKHEKTEVFDKMSVQSKNSRKYIIPAMISNAAFFVLTILHYLAKKGKLRFYKFKVEF